MYYYLVDNRKIQVRIKILLTKNFIIMTIFIIFVTSLKSNL